MDYPVMDYGMNGDPMDPKCKHGVWMVSKPDRRVFCEDCRDEAMKLSRNRKK